MSIERLKVVHALSLGSVALFVVIFTRKFKVLNEKHYAQLLLAAVVITVLYFIPVVWLGYQGLRMAGQFYYQGTDFAISPEKSSFAVNIKRFADWSYMMLKRSDLGSVGLVISGLIHL